MYRYLTRGKENITSYLVPDNTLTHGAAIKRANGTIAIGGLKGITSFNPKELKKKSFCSPGVISRASKVLNQELTIGEIGTSIDQAISHTNTLNLTYDQNFIELKFAALSYAEPHRTEFKYMLQGFDQDWIQANQNRIASYTNLPPGEYKFQVQASNNHGVWNKTGTTLLINITPAFWQTVWFKSIIDCSRHGYRLPHH